MAPRLIERASIPEIVPVLPLRNSVFFPGGVLPLAVGRPRTIALVKEAVRDDLLIGIVTQRRAEEEDPDFNDLYAVGTVARIVKFMKIGEDNYSLVVQGLARLRVLEPRRVAPYLTARVEALEDDEKADTVEIQALGINVKRRAREVIALMPELPAAASELVESITHPGHLVDLIAANIDVPLEEKQAVLETLDLKLRMNLVLELLNRKREILELANRIDQRVKAQVTTRQREYYLRQQLLVIQELLGGASSDELPARLDAATGNLRRLRAKLEPLLPPELIGELDAILAELASCAPRIVPSNENDD